MCCLGLILWFALSQHTQDVMSTLDSRLAFELRFRERHSPDFLFEEPCFYLVNVFAGDSEGGIFLRGEPVIIWKDLERTVLLEHLLELLKVNVRSLTAGHLPRHLEEYDLPFGLDASDKLG